MGSCNGMGSCDKSEQNSIEGMKLSMFILYNHVSSLYLSGVTSSKVAKNIKTEKKEKKNDQYYAYTSTYIYFLIM